MLVLITYDVNVCGEGGTRRLNHVAKLCESWGQRVQFSVFECLLEPAQWVQLRRDLLNEIDMEHDSLRFYMLGANWQRRVEVIGAKKSYNPQGNLIL
ncbi:MULTISPECIES: CRISPR-associated endonuclease Cas2 [Jonquetella]|uniref:CRISPR-associated endoribonuclease Cas2 n=1 Tax=Jonquetella anthropi DSM 22815 TaxID=885272 RepID=H0UMN2_9BACT|nr:MULTISPECIES: CRISPR-associated endonuclease Cas2 [Jonquetella]EEX49282.1 CRISPR-associated protein Cas2 [Jonquetella anthropi E3_33 E1]EHM13735.1 CRISPR-associated endoribonuclease Cas2 [Jonquetella anthropi DSM 22815]ERL23915.1 CRISPR-associated endonuclease Cas2 [Jonquetella sp. BV3C21]